jgi:hypothetical protein
MNDRSNFTPIEEDLGVTVGRASAARSRSVVSSDVVSVSKDIQRHAVALVENTSIPETTVGRLLDSLFPDPIRRERRKGDESIARAEIGARVRIHEAVKEAQVRQVETLAEAYGRACVLQAQEEIGVRALEAATKVDAEIGRSGAEFDRVIEAEVKEAASLESQSARTARAERLQRRISLRGEVEEVILEAIRDAVSVPRRPA